MVNKHRAIPDGFLTVGELAKKMRTTVRTLQFYDRIGLLIPAGESAGGRRLYDASDVVRLHQILALKQLGFSLEDIRTRLVDLKSPAAVADALDQQAAAVRGQVETLTRALADLEALREEVLRIDHVDFTRYAQIITLLKSSNDNLWVMRLVGDQMRDRIIELDDATKAVVWEKTLAASTAAAELHERGADPAGPEALTAAGLMWEAVFAFAGDQPELMTEMYALDQRHSEWEGEFAQTYTAAARAFLDTAMPSWLARNYAALSPAWQRWLQSQAGEQASA